MINETGNRYGKLVVIKPDYSKGKLKWLCQCDCGGEALVDGADLRRGHTKSCGCYQKQRTSEASVVDYTGQRFGELLVLERDMNYTGKQIKTHWFCKCLACGNITSIASDCLKRGQLSCGCINSKGEYKISCLLNNNHIRYKKEFTFDNYKNRRFDFAILDNNDNPIRLIEFDGIQHYYRPEEWLWTKTMDLEEQQKRDIEKNNIAKEYNIDLIRIPYWKLDSLTINQLLDNTFLI